MDIVYARNFFIGWLYKNLARPVFFLSDPEKIHDRIIYLGSLIGRYWVTRKITRAFFGYSNPFLRQVILGVKFENPIGLAAGFDKDARLTGILPSVGFGFAEVGSITGSPCQGNPKPRLWRLKESKGLVVHYGLKNKGAKIIADYLQRVRFEIPIGINIAKTNSPETVDFAEGVRDYVKSYREFIDIGHFYTINISCPNAYGGEPFHDPQKLDLLLEEIGKLPQTKPVFIKIAPDLSCEELDSIINVAGKHKIDGFVCANLTKKHELYSDKIKEKNIPGRGGISGKVVEDLANKTIEYIYSKTNGKFIIVGCGGVFSAEDAYYKIKLGASLIELITGMIFEGPQLISEINRGLVELLKKDGYDNISQAIGSAYIKR